MLETLLQLLWSSDLIYATLRLTTPLLFAALGGLMCERAGVLNIGLEGLMLGGALTAYLVALKTGSPWLGLLAGALAGLVTALLFAVVAVTFRANQIVSAVGLNILMLGLTGVALRAVVGLSSGQNAAPTIPIWNIPGLGDLPGLGPVLFRHLPLVYLVFILVGVVAFIFYRTTWGLAIRAVGEHPRAAETVGINVIQVRYLTLLWSGFMAGVGGALLSVGYLNTFQEGMTAGRGFIAFSAIIFGRWTPLGTMLASLLFGFADALQLRIQAFGAPIPYQFLVMLPYVVTLLALFGAGRSQSPAASGAPYAPGEA
ncbi:MAG TPA: ABC transporter permease [Anaerolineales bacterium]|nr:ABC transporter permease [Anaerolineales bacterium]